MVDDGQAATVDLLRGEPVRLQLVGGHLDQEAVRAAVDVVGRDVREFGQLVVVLVVICLGDRAQFDHAVQDVVVALQQCLPRLLTIGRIECGRLVDDGRQRHRLRQRQVRGVDAEERVGRRLDTVGAASEVDRV